MEMQGRILCSIKDINISALLKNGQSFRWSKSASAEEWVGPLGHHLWILNQDSQGIDFMVKTKTSATSFRDEMLAACFLHDYFQLKVPLDELYNQWSTANTAFKSTSERLPGIRVLRQDPVENLFCFICSSNNNIQRITAMVENMCRKYGSPIGEHRDQTYFSFPSVARLAADGVEAELRALGFGYRAKFIQEAARQILTNGGEAWLRNLRKLSYEDCHKELCKLCGVGAKVADCVCLMSLDQPAAVPVDTHVHQLAARHFLPQLRHVKSLTPAAYRQVADVFRKLFGDYAGWAQAVMFIGDLNEFKKQKPASADAPPNPPSQRKPSEAKVEKGIRDKGDNNQSTRKRAKRTSKNHDKEAVLLSSDNCRESAVNSRDRDDQSGHVLRSGRCAGVKRWT